MSFEISYVILYSLLLYSLHADLYTSENLINIEI